MAKKNVKSAEPKKKKPISLNILEIAKRLQKLEETGGGEPYTLPTASADTKGGVKIGSGLSMTGEVLSADAASASDVSYDNTTSGMTATTVQGAIDEVAGDVAGLSADDVSYGTGTVDDALDVLNTYQEITNWLRNSLYPSNTGITAGEWFWMMHKVLGPGLYYINASVNIQADGDATSLLQRVRSGTNDNIILYNTDSVTSKQRSFGTCAMIQLTETTDVYLDVYCGGAAHVFSDNCFAVKIR